MKRQTWLVAALIGFVGLVTGFTVGSKNSAPPPNLVVSEVMTGLQVPWDLAFLSDGTMFFTEKCRGLSVHLPDSTKVHLFGVAGAAMEAPDLVCEGQSGVGSVVVDPDFVNNHYAYVFMSSSITTNPRTNRVVRLKLTDDLKGVTERTDIITDIAYKDVANAWGAPGSHSGSRMRFGPDGYLYITTGDNHNGPLPQNLTLLGGKVLRVDRNGVAAKENAPPAGADPRIFTYGHRNPQGLAFHPTTGRAFIAEHGPNHSDEVTALTNGGNGGWDPQPEAGVICADNYCGYISNKPSGVLTPMTDLEKFPDALVPSWVLQDSQGMGPATFLSGAQWQGWDGALLVGVMATMKLHIVQLDANDMATSSLEVNLPSARYRSLVQGPDGFLYTSTDDGRILKVVPQ